MAGVKLGDRVLFAGTGDVTLATAVAMRSGLSGRVVVLAPDAAEATARAARIEAAGAMSIPFVTATTISSRHAPVPPRTAP